MEYKITRAAGYQPASKQGLSEVSNTDRGAIVGMVLGDGCIRRRKRYEEGRETQIQTLFQCSHSIRQLPYAEHKRDRLNAILGGKAKMTFYDVHLPKLGKSYRTCRFVKTGKYFENLREALYVEGKKIITPKLLNWLSMEGLAYYYLDDGCADWWKRVDGAVSSVQVTLAVCRPVHECDILIGWLQDKLGIESRITITNTHNYLRIKTQSARKLFDAIRPYVPHSMLYKIDPNYVSHEHQAPGKLRTGEDIV